jgi:hypothetical protein
MVDSCKVCGARRMWLPNSKGGLRPEPIDDHKKAAEINAMIEDEKISKLQEQQQAIVLEATVPRKRRRPKV